MSFSVLYEPLIPVELCDGSRRDVGLREAFLKAHEFRDILGDTPLERYAVLRLMIAFAMDMLHPADSYDRQDLLEQGKFDEGTFDAYIAKCEKDGPRFDLLDTEHPFMQSKHNEGETPKTIARLQNHLPTGRNHMFFDHRSESDHACTLPEAFRSMCGSYAFCQSGGAGYHPGINGAPPLYVIIVGNNLFETIVCNMLSKAEAGNIAFGEGSVPWRTNTSINSEEQATASLIEGLAWMPRKISLIQDNDGMVRKTYYGPGPWLSRENNLWRDPHLSYRKQGEVFYPVPFQTGRMPWRDIGSLCYAESDANTRRPMTLSNENILDAMSSDRELHLLSLRVVGLATDNKAKDYEWYSDTLSIPLLVLTNVEAANALRDDVNEVEFILDAIRKGIDDAFYIVKKRKKKKGSPTKEKTFCAQVQQHYLSLAHYLIMNVAMLDIAEGKTIMEHASNFHERLKEIIQDTLHVVLEKLGTNETAMEIQLETERNVWISFHKAVKERMERYA